MPRSDIKVAEPGSRRVHVIGALAFMALGAVTIQQSGRFDYLGAITPSFIGGAMIALALLLLATTLLRPAMVPAPGLAAGSLARRGLLALVLVVWVAILPTLGFVVSALLAFAAIVALVPRETPWRRRDILFHAAGATAVTLGFWLLLARVLRVPLPEGVLF